MYSPSLFQSAEIKSKAVRVGGKCPAPELRLKKAEMAEEWGSAEDETVEKVLRADT